ncbi:MAG: type II toxin-antitoxin system RelE/ParE family toxin [Acidobacteria bacterium]|nr:type II toxin-antitoxin system RelE/ParE family toxin [Acidobacteriota bacterium]
MKRLPVRFYRGESGAEPVRDWLGRLSLEDKQVIGEDIKDVEYAWPIGMPLVKSLGDGLWEVHSSLAGGRIARVLFCVEGGEMVLLHAFFKKSQVAPLREIQLARQRMKGVNR